MLDGMHLYKSMDMYFVGTLFSDKYWFAHWDKTLEVGRKERLTRQKRSLSLILPKEFT